MKYDGILFDLDGTLWNSTEALAKSWEPVLSSLPDIDRAITVEDFERVMGMTALDLMHNLYPHLSDERALEVFDLCCEAENKYLSENGAILYEGIEEMVQTLSENLPLFIVSNCNDGYIPAFLTSHKMYPYFKDWECIGVTGKEKWENIKLVVERNGLKSPVYVGDTALDMKSAQMAGVPFIHAAYGFGKIENVEAVSSPDELTKLILEN